MKLKARKLTLDARLLQKGDFLDEGVVRSVIIKREPSLVPDEARTIVAVQTERSTSWRMGPGEPLRTAMIREHLVFLPGCAVEVWRNEMLP